MDDNTKDYKGRITQEFLDSLDNTGLSREIETLRHLAQQYQENLSDLNSHGFMPQEVRDPEIIEDLERDLNILIAEKSRREGVGEPQRGGMGKMR